MTSQRMMPLVLVMLAQSIAWAMDLRGWQLHDDDEQHIAKVLERAQQYDVNHVQLSHGIIMNIDDAVRDAPRAALINRVTKNAHGRKMEVFVWAHEFVVPDNRRIPLQCLDPDAGGKEFWAARLQAYRDFRAACPEVDGVVLMFGSSPMEPWHVLHGCEFCKNLQGGARVRFVIERFQRVVQDELGLKLMFRTFNHAPAQLRWIRDAIPHLKNLTLMPKCVPQDWQPYYPHHPVIADHAGLPTVVEVDLAMEYMGQSRIMAPMVDLLREYVSHWQEYGVRGYVARIERGSSGIFDTPNEINAYALKRFTETPDLHPDQCFDEWFKAKYGTEGDENLAYLRSLFRDTFTSARLMYYVLGFWCLEKGSGIPKIVTHPALLDSRSNHLWDPAWEPMYRRLKSPDIEVVEWIIEEKSYAAALVNPHRRKMKFDGEARSLAPKNAGLIDDFLTKLEFQFYYARVWMMLVWGMFVWQHHQQLDDGNTREKNQCLWDLFLLKGDFRHFQQDEWWHKINADDRNRIIDAGTAFQKIVDRYPNPVEPETRLISSGGGYLSPSEITTLETPGENGWRVPFRAEGHLASRMSNVQLRYGPEFEFSEAVSTSVLLPRDAYGGQQRQWSFSVTHGQRNRLWKYRVEARLDSGLNYRSPEMWFVPERTLNWPDPVVPGREEPAKAPQASPSKEEEF